MRKVLLLVALSGVITVGCREAESVEPQSAASGDAPPTSVTPATDTTRPVTAAQQLVAELYKRHTAGDTPFFQTESRQRLEAYFEATLADLIWNDAVSSKGEVGALSFDPLYNAQDTEITNFLVHPATTDGLGTHVTVTFNNFDKPERLAYLLARVGTEWRIADIDYGETTLREILKTAASGT